MNKARATGRHGGPDQAEWDFSKCPTDKLQSCWKYEFAREVRRIVDSYKQDKREDRIWGLGSMNRGFDADGVWYYFETMIVDGSERRISLDLPPGFPDKPYQAIHDARKERHGILPHNVGLQFMNHPLRDHQEIETYLKAGGLECGILGQADYQISVDWRVPDKVLKEYFGYWLNRRRGNRKHDETRGKSKSRAWRSELKALGAYRLLAKMTAPAAMDYSARVAGRPLYAKIPDWYGAKKEAARILKADFGDEQQ